MRNFYLWILNRFDRWVLKVLLTTHKISFAARRPRIFRISVAEFLSSERANAHPQVAITLPPEERDCNVQPENGDRATHSRVVNTVYTFLNKEHREKIKNQKNNNIIKT